MQTTLRIIWTIAFWLTLAFSALTPSATALANCKLAGQPSAPRTCCITHLGACCHGAQKGSLPGGTTSKNCRMSDCSCDLIPIRDRAPLPASIVEHSFPAILIANAPIFNRTTPRRGPPIASACHIVQNVSLPSSSPRAPPFQG